MNTEGLRAAFVDWLAKNETWQDRLTLQAAEEDRLLCTLDDLRITFDFRNRSFSHSSSRDNIQYWADICEDALSSLDPSSGLSPFFTHVFTEYESILWESNSSESSEDPIIVPDPPVDLDTEWVLQHVVFRAAQEAQEQLERDRGLDLMVRPESKTVKLRLDLGAMGVTAGSCEELGLMSDERVLLSLTYSKDLLRSTMQEFWTSPLFDEVGLCCTTEMEVLNMGAALYFPGLVKLVFDRLKKKAEELPPGIVLYDAADQLVKMGFSLSDATKALKKAHGNQERAIEKLSKWSTLYEWIREDVLNPFTCLCLSLTAFLSAHTKYCRNCYLRHPTQSQVLRYCWKKGCLRALMQTEFELLGVVKGNEAWVELELSFFSMVSQEGHPALFKFMTSDSLPLILSSLPALSKLQQIAEERMLILELGLAAYEIIRKILQTSPLLVKQVDLHAEKVLSADSNIVSQLHDKGVQNLLSVESNSSEFISAFEAEKVIYGSKIGFFVSSGSWFEVLREGTYKRMLVGGMEVSCGRWASVRLSVAQALCFPERTGTGWLNSVHKARAVVAVVEFINKPEYAKSTIFVIPNSRHFLIRYFAIVPLPEFVRQPTAAVTSSNFSYQQPWVNRDPPFPANPPVSRPFESVPFNPGAPSLPANPPVFRPFQSAQPSLAPNFEQARESGNLTRIVNPDALPLTQQAFYMQIDEQHRRNFSRLVWELMEIRINGGKWVQVELDADINVFQWYVTVVPDPEWGLSQELMADLDAISRKQGKREGIKVRATFNAFFPLMSPFFILNSPQLRSSNLTKDGFILRPPLWKQESTVMEHLQLAVKHVLTAAGARLDL